MGFCLFIVYVYICLCATCMPSALGGQKRASDALELEIQKDASFHMGAGSPLRTQTLLVIAELRLQSWAWCSSRRLSKLRHEGSRNPNSCPHAYTAISPIPPLTISTYRAKASLGYLKACVRKTKHISSGLLDNKPIRFP